MSLKKILHNKIQSQGTMPYSQVEQICKENGYKISNAERCLRRSESPDVKTIYSKKGFIVGYEWKRVGEQGKLFKESYADREKREFHSMPGNGLLGE